MRLPLAITLAVAGAAACGGGDGGEGTILRALGDDVDLVVVADPRVVADTWVERAAMLVVPELPVCVRDRARRADAVVVTWAQRDGSAGDWSLVLTGGGATATGCEELERDGALAWLGPDPRGGERRFFARAERKRRWRALGTAPVRAIGDVEVQAGIVVHASGHVDPRDGVAARARLRFDDPSAATGFEAQRDRWRRDLDRKRLGGAWPAFGITIERDKADAAGTTLRAELDVPGKLGDEAMLLATAALLAGELGGVRTPTAPCPDWIADPWHDELSCSDGTFTIAAALRDRVLLDPMLLAGGARVVPAIKNGSPAGFKLYAIRPSSLVAALGLANGDRVHTVDGTAVSSMDSALDVYSRLRTATRVTVEVERRGQDLALQYEIR